MGASGWSASSASRASRRAKGRTWPSTARRPGPASRPPAPEARRRALVRVFNFAAGPAALPAEVLDQVRADLPDWQRCGMSVLEVSHRSRAFLDVAQEAERRLRELLAIPGGVRVVFPHRRATPRFSPLPPRPPTPPP